MANNYRLAKYECQKCGKEFYGQPHDNGADALIAHEDWHDQGEPELAEYRGLGDEVPMARNEYEKRLAKLVRNAVLDDIERRLPDVSNRPHEVQQERGRVLRIIEDIRRGLRSS